jgi:uncharacterized membrane protein SirB2
MDLGGLVEAVAATARPWRDVYVASTAVGTAIVFAHVAALIVAAGFTLSAHRATWRVARSPDAAERALHLAELARARPIVVRALAVVMASGVVLALTDVETYAWAPLFWMKMLLVAALLANGYVMLRDERALRRAVAHADAAAEQRAWDRLRRGAVASGVLWMTTVLAGTALQTV